MKPLSVLRNSLDFCKSKALYGYLLGLSLCGWAACSVSASATNLDISVQNVVTQNQAIAATSFSQSNSVTSSLLAQGNGSRIYTIIRLSDVEAILRDTDILYKRESATLLRFDVSSYKILANLQGCRNSNSESCDSLLLSIRVRLPSRPNAALVNDWNRLKRGSRTYIDTNDALVLETDIYAIGGITEQHLRSQIASFILAVGSFSEHMGLR